jgi:hypothetical protein
VVNRQLQKRGDHRFVAVSLTAYAGRAAGVLSYETFNVCCFLPPGHRWKVEPRMGRTVQVQGNLVGFYLVDGRVSPCLLTQTLSYVGQSATTESASTASPSPVTPRKRRLGEVVPPTLTAAPMPRPHL